ncbi:MAG: carboxypeptidase regulatory-like domain-containing protein [Planctomycetes bacterium]|nr:carboxypeptidase regulatory-like domain-containing protein [Planctomycetota bacterium]
MTQRVLLLVGGLVLALVSWLLWPSPAASPLPGDPQPADANGPTQPPTPPPSAAVADTPFAREPAVEPRRAETPPLATSAQGLRGTVVDTDGAPLAGVAVHLLDGAEHEPLLASARAPEVDLMPLATTRTSPDGRFALGLPIVQDRSYELCFVSPGHTLLRSGPYRLLADEWHELGSFVLQRGATIRGRVTVQGQDAIPVPQAQVGIEFGTSFADAVLQALPDSGSALRATTDAGGYYEILHAPNRGTAWISASAPGFARVTRNDLDLATVANVRVDFALPPGQRLSGTVADDRGQAVPDARVEAWQQRPGAPPLVGRSDANGDFVVHGLLPNESYRLTVRAEGHETAELLPVAPGSSGLRLVLVPHTALSLGVTTPDGQPVRTYRVAVRRWFEGPPASLGALPELQEQFVRLGPGADRFEIPGLPRGMLVVEVETAGFAKTFSNPVDNRLDPALPPRPRWQSVDLVLAAGASLRGVVRGDDGRPLAGASIRTQRNGAKPDSPIGRLLRGSLPDRISLVEARTDRDGTFALVDLAAGDYQLVLEHPEASGLVVPDLVARAGQTTTVPDVVLPRGASVEGRVTVDGRPPGQAKVILTTAANDGRNGGLRLETVTDPDGSYRLPRRVPPGEYVLRSAVVTNAEPEAQIARQLLQLQRSSTNVSVPPGMLRVVRDLDIPSDR